MLLRRGNINCIEDAASTHGYSESDADLDHGACHSHANRYAPAIRYAQPNLHPGHAFSHAHQHPHAHTAAQCDTDPDTQHDTSTQRHAAPAERHARTEPHQLTRSSRG